MKLSLPLSLDEIVTATQAELFPWGGWAVLSHFQVEGISIDSRQVNAGELFFALRGDHFDGHNFVEQSLKRNAAAAVVAREWFENQSSNPNGLFMIVPDTLRAFQNLAAYYRQKFSVMLVAITGTNGKTTTKEMAYQVLSKKFTVVRNQGNLNNHIGVPLTLFQLRPNISVAVVEMGANHFGEIWRLCEIARPNVGLITNVGSGHLEFFGTVRDVARAKAELFDYLDATGIALVNLDDPLVVEVAQRVQHRRTFGFSPQAEIKGTYLGMDELGCPSFNLQDEIAINLQVLGRHQAHNALAASAMGVHWGVPLTAIKQALEAYQGFSKRMEIIKLGSTLLLNDTYNANPDSTQQALKTLQHIVQNHGGRSFAVLADMLELGEQSTKAHQQIGLIASQLEIDFLLTFGKEARTISEAAQQHGLQQVFHFTDKFKIVPFLLSQLQKSDAILVKGSRGMLMEEVVEELKARMRSQKPNEANF